MAQLSMIEQVKNHKQQSNMKDKFIKNLQPGDQIANFLAVVKDIKKGKTSQNKDFIDLVLVDRTGEIVAKIWEDNLVRCDKFVAGDVISLSGKISEFKDKNQIIISFLQCVQDQNPADFLPISNQDSNILLKHIQKHIQSINDEYLKKLANHFYSDKKIIQKIKAAPAAERIHHAYIGGFVEHINEMLNMAHCLYENYPNIDFDLLRTGILLHDLGKLEEFAFNHAIYTTAEGNLLGHIVLGSIKVAKAIDEFKDFPDLLKIKVLHLIVSHHGRLEFGSPVLPQTREAVALYYIDELSAKVNVADNVVKSSANEKREFSDRVFALQNSKLFLN